MLDAAGLNAIAGGLYRTQLLYVVARLRIADKVADGPRTASELAEETGADVDALFRVLRAAASLGVLTQDERDRFGPTEASELLRPGSRGSPHARLLCYGEPWWWAATGGMYETVMGGGSGFERVHGMGLFDYLAGDEDASTVFDAHMTAMTEREAASVVPAVDWPQQGTVVDIAGGRGTLLRAILDVRPDLNGVLFDLPHVVEHADLPDRCERIAGDFFTAVPGGGDLYLMKDILHDWDDERAAQILQTVRAAIPDSARLMVIERAIPPGDAPSPGKLVDMAMLVVTGGRERTRDEYSRLLQQTGFTLQDVTPTQAGTDVLTATPA